MKLGQFSKKLISLCISASVCLSPLAYSKDIDLPDIGTVASATLTIAQEEIYGDAYMRSMRASQPIIHDPVLSDYINAIGHRLVANSENVKTPFYFFLIRNRELNAFAFFGGHVAVHSGIFLHTRTESELASILAHEISHVTQRHLARSMEAEAKRTPATIAALAGSLLLAIAAPQAGVAALSATTAGTIQSKINYTRANEKEADRFGIATLAKAGFNPYAMPRFFGRLADEYRYASTPPAMLLTHPLPQSRITDSRQRANHYKHVKLAPSLQYQLARVRIIARYTGLEDDAALDWINRHDKENISTIHSAMEYGRALVYLDTKKFNKAKPIIKKLLTSAPLNLFYLDAASDLYIGLKKPMQSVSLLKTALQQSPDNNVIMVNYANALLEAKENNKAIKVLQRYTHDHPEDTIGWSLLSKADAKTGNQAEELASRAELHALKADWDQAIQLYSQASQLAKLGSLEQARYDARIDQLMAKRAQFLALKQ
ncbi:M48 family metalloprotease [Vibrio salinus]|uniref:beta-barrel assembly-enhancing protease n=1 Tax=Vibrio salinus TaxID=2899784 RepID=UPI001E3124FB|nr:M48 family metalloprotease [Vibrio salinus]MCE0494469.1 M48 family metalloprotease [Vibrio salinus]